MSRHDIDNLTKAAMDLMQLGIDDLYATLGQQLLGFTLPQRAAGIATYLSAVRKASQAIGLVEALPPGPSLAEMGVALGKIHEDLRRDGIRYLTEVSGDLRNALCTEALFRLSEQISRPTMRVIILVVGDALKMPREFDAISATVAVIILKLGLKDFCW